MIKTIKYYITLLIISLLTSGCFAVGPSFIIKTENPTDDFIVECAWGSSAMSFIHGGGTVIDTDYYVIPSGEEFDCGMRVIGERGYAKVSHPLYAKTGVCDGRGCKSEKSKSGAYIVRPKEKLKLLDECEQQYKDGYWSKHYSPESEYGSCMARVCSFPDVDLYMKFDKSKNTDYFRNKYGDDILLCYKRITPVLKKYLPGTYKSREEAKIYVEKAWSRIREESL